MSNSEDIPKFYPMGFDRFPKVENLVGEARKFSEDFISNVSNFRTYQYFGVQPDKVYLLEGEPGTGKTMAVNAIKNTMNKDLYEYTMALNKDDRPTDQEMRRQCKGLFFEYSIGEHGTAYINMGSRRVQGFFETAYLASLKVPTVIVMDEVDALLSSRTSNIQSTSEDRKMLETIMKNMQKLHDTPNMYAILMTNTSDQCDVASLRAGRVDKRIVFNKPNYEERVHAYRSMIRQAKEKVDFDIFGRLNFSRLGERSEGFNYADIDYSIQDSIKSKIKNIITSKSNKIITVERITMGDLEKSVLEHKKSFVKKDKAKVGF